jgi:UDP-N-acetyl-D-glucosamine dehydrogenase
MAYKRDVDDSRDSPGFAILERLIEKGARVRYNDPHVPRIRAFCAFRRWRASH